MQRVILHRWAYIYSTGKLLRQALIEDEADGTSKNDFGKNIIPKNH